jgi:hypothetical protein
MVGEDGTVTIESPAELMNVEVRAIRQWSAIGSLQIERRGNAELVHLGQVKALARSPIVIGDRKENQRGGLRALLREATPVDAQSVAGLQALARERGRDNRPLPDTTERIGSSCADGFPQAGESLLRGPGP